MAQFWQVEEEEEGDLERQPGIVSWVQVLLLERKRPGWHSLHEPSFNNFLHDTANDLFPGSYLHNPSTKS